MFSGIFRVDRGDQELEETLNFQELKTIDMDVSKEEAMKDSKIVKVILSPFSNQMIISEKFNNSNDIPFRLFALYDEKGNVLDVLYNGGSYGLEGARNSFEFIKANKDTKTLRLVPIYTYADNAPKEINYNPIVDIDKFPMELKMSSKGSLVIEKIQYEDTQTKISYTKKGVVLNPYDHFRLIDEDGKIVEGEKLIHGNGDIIIVNKEASDIKPPAKPPGDFLPVVFNFICMYSTVGRNTKELR